MVADLWITEPEEGDQFWTQPVRITKNGTILGRSPVNWGAPLIKIIDSRDTEGYLTEEVEGSGSFPSNQAPVFCEVVNKQDGRITVKTRPSDEWPDGEDTDQSSVEWNERSERIEWTGTKQEIDGEDAKRRTSVFNEEEPRGSRNDLLNGHH